MDQRQPYLIARLEQALPDSRWLRDLALILPFAVVYYYAAEIGLHLDDVHLGVVAMWPPAAIAVAVLILFGYRLWPGIFLAAFLSELHGNHHVLVAFATAAGSSLEDLAAAYLVNKYARGSKAFDTAQDVFRFAFFACVLAPAISATIGISSYYVFGLASRAELVHLWISWWLGTGSSILLLTPFLLIIFDRPHHHLAGPELFELVCLVLGVIFISLAAFGPLSPVLNQKVFFRGWMCIPFLVWAAFRFCQLEVAGLTILVFGAAVWGTIHGFGYFVGPDFHASLLSLDIFITIVGTMSLAVAALVAERRGVVTKLLGVQGLLQEEVAGKDRDLTATVDTLHSEVVEHLESERALRDSNERFRLVMERTSLVFWVLDVIAGKILYVSPTYETIWGRSRESLYADANTWLDSIHPDDRKTLVLPRAQADNGGGFEHEYRILRSDGSVCWIQDRGFVVRDETGRVCAAAGIASEIPAARRVIPAVTGARRDDLRVN